MVALLSLVKCNLSEPMHVPEAILVSAAVEKNSKAVGSRPCRVMHIYLPFAVIHTAGAKVGLKMGLL